MAGQRKNQGRQSAIGLLFDGGKQADAPACPEGSGVDVPAASTKNPTRLRIT